MSVGLWGGAGRGLCDVTSYSLGAIHALQRGFAAAPKSSKRKNEGRRYKPAAGRQQEKWQFRSTEKKILKMNSDRVVFRVHRCGSGICTGAGMRASFSLSCFVTGERWMV